MSQSASFYSLSSEYFKKIEKDSSIEISSVSKSFIVLEQNHEGVAFILSKILPNKLDLVSAIFNPTNSIGGLGFDNIDFETIEDDFYLENKILIYLTPDEVATIAQMLEPLHKKDISDNYSASEFNQAGVYPRVWSEFSTSDEAFNLEHLIEGFNLLKSFIFKAAHDNSYVFTFVG